MVVVTSDSDACVVCWFRPEKNNKKTKVEYPTCQSGQIHRGPGIMRLLLYERVLFPIIREVIMRLLLYERVIMRFSWSYYTRGYYFRFDDYTHSLETSIGNVMLFIETIIGIIILCIIYDL